MVSLPKVWGHEKHDNIIPKPMFTDTLPCSSTDVDVKINGIAIGTIRQHPEFYTPFGWLVLYELAKPRPVMRLCHALVNCHIFLGHMQFFAKFFKILYEGLLYVAYFEGLLLRDLPHARWLRLLNTSCGKGLRGPRDHRRGSSYSSSSGCSTRVLIPLLFLYS